MNTQAEAKTKQCRRNAEVACGGMLLESSTAANEVRSGETFWQVQRGTEVLFCGGKTAQ